jgi:hypothetical protein
MISRLEHSAVVAHVKEANYSIVVIIDPQLEIGFSLRHEAKRNFDLSVKLK